MDYSHLGTKVASNIREEMRKKSITQEELGEKLYGEKDKQSNVSQILRAMEKKGNGSLKTISKIAEILGVDPLYFFK